VIITGIGTTEQECREREQNQQPRPEGRGCCLGEVFVSGFNTFLTALKGGVLNPSQTIKNFFIFKTSKNYL
jgi:hypothetical protein